MKVRKMIKLMMFPLFALLMLLGTQTVNAQTVNLTKINTDWFKSYTFKGEYSSWYLKDYSFNGRTAYCIEPTIPEGESYNTGDWSVTNYTNEQKEKALLIAYYGYDYPNHQTREYRAATQALLWELMGTSTVVFSSERYDRGTIYNVDKEKQEIMNLVNNHTKKPSFNGTTITLNVGEEITLTDTNKVLSNYEVYSSENADAHINEDNNTLTVKATAVGDITIRFAKKQYLNTQYLVYYSEGHQTLLSPGTVDPVYSDLNIKSLGGKIEFTKYDKDNNTNTPQGLATLSGAIYGIYDAETDTLIQTVTTNDDGYAISNNLPKLGEYYLQEITPSEGYQIDLTRYYFSSSLEQINASLIVKEDVITRDFEFTKVIATDKTGIMTPEANVEFGIYDHNNQLYTKVTTDSEGKIYVTLPYGKYTLKQLTSTTNHEMLEDYEFEVKELGDTVNKVFANAEITAKLKVIKVDADTGQTIALSGIKFKIFDLNNNEYVCQTTDRVQCVFETNEQGILMTPLPLNSGNYRLEEIDQVINGYLWNPEALEFSINEDSNFENDDVFGTIIELEFENTSVKGKVEINKLGEEIDLTENGYVFNKINLENVVFGLYAKEDIYDTLGNLIYEKDTLIAELVTNADGYTSIDNLYLGEYYLKELKTVSNHVLDSNIYTFKLEYKDQYTAEVLYTIDLENLVSTGSLIFSKVDFSTSEPLPNTLIEIYNDKEELVFSGRTDESGQIKIDRLPLGRYFILEKEAPSGYKINTEKMYFEIKENNEIIKCTMTNEVFEVPNTGLSNINFEIIVSIVLVISGLGLIGYGFCKKKK